MTGTDLVPAGDDSPFAVLQMQPAELQDLISENLSAGDNLTPKDLTRVKVPAGGATSWEVPTIRGEESRKVLEGVVIRRDTRRAFWRGKYEGGNDQPDCYSDDGVFGHGDPGGQCSACPYNEFGSHENGVAKACKETRQLFLLTPDGLLPMLVTVPPGSLANAKAYFVGLMNARIRATEIVTQLSLTRAENQGGIKYSRVEFTAGAPLAPDASAQIKSYAQLLAPFLERSARLERDDLGQDEG